MGKKICRARIIEILKGVNELENLNGIDLVYRIIENISLLEAEKNKIDRVAKHLDFSKEYQEEYNKIVADEIEYDEQGKPKMLNESQIALKKDNNFTSRMQEFELKFKDEIERVKLEREQFSNYMEEELELNFIPIKKELLPKDITLRQYQLLTDMLETQS